MKLTDVKPKQCSEGRCDAGAQTKFRLGRLGSTKSDYRHLKNGLKDVVANFFKISVKEKQAR